MVVTASEVHAMVDVPGVTVMPFHPSHVERIGLNRFDKEIFAASPDVKERLQLVHQNRCGWTIFYKRQPALVMGLEYKFPTNYEAWLLTGSIAYQNPGLFSRGAKRFFDKVGAKLNLRRMQIVVNVHHKAAVKWAQFLGFEREGRMKGYGPEGSDYFMYARTY